MNENKSKKYTEIKENTHVFDEKNKLAYDILVTKRQDSFLKHVFTDENGKQRSYAEMRMLYG
jgi:hypothetical protein